MAVLRLLLEWKLGQTPHGIDQGDYRRHSQGLLLGSFSTQWSFVFVFCILEIRKWSPKLGKSFVRSSHIGQDQVGGLEPARSSPPIQPVRSRRKRLVQSP